MSDAARQGEHGEVGQGGAQEWDAVAVRSLRSRLGLTQAEFADRVGTRQQTISEWETGTSRPRRMSQRLLRMVAESSAAYVTSEAGEPGLDDPGRPAQAGED